MGRVCTELPPTEHHQPHALSVDTRPPAPALSVDRIALGGSSCRLLIPSERGSVALNYQLPARRPSISVHPGPESPLHWSVHDPEADQRGYLPAMF